MEKLVDALQLPKDLMLGAMNVKLVGQYEAYIENYKSILEYNDKMIIIDGKNTRVTIVGDKLRIICFTKDDMRIKGCIYQVNFGK